MRTLGICRIRCPLSQWDSQQPKGLTPNSAMKRILVLIQELLGHSGGDRTELLAVSLPPHIAQSHVGPVEVRVRQILAAAWKPVDCAGVEARGLAELAEALHDGTQPPVPGW